MADVVVGAKLELDGAGAINSVKNFKQELKQAQQEVITLSEKFGATSKEAAAAAKKAAELKDAIGDAKSLVDAFNPDTKFRALGASINTVVGGFTALQGVLGLVGGESEEVNKALLKVQSALAISQGIAQLQEGIQTFKNLGAVIQASTIFQRANAAATALASGAMRLFGVNVATTSTSFQVLKGAIIATGIGALVIGLTVAVQALASFASGSDDAAAAQARLKAEIEGVNELLEGEKSIYANQEKLEIARAKRAGATEEQIFNIQQKYRRLNAQATADAIAAISDQNSEGARKLLQDLENQNIAGQVAQIDFETRELERKKQAAAKANRELIEQRKRLLAEAEEAQKNKTANFTATGGPGAGLKIEIPKSEEQIQIENTVAAAQKALEDKGRIFLEESTLRSTAYNEIKDNAYNQMLLDQQVYETRQRYADATGNLLKSLSSLVGQQTAAGKVFAIAAATIDTYSAIAATLKNVARSPQGAIPGFAIAQAIATGIFGLAQVAKIASTKVPGGGGSGSAPSLSVSAPLTPQKPQQQSTTLDQASINSLNNATTRAFVLESDITNNQERIRRLNRSARIGN